MSNLPGFAVDEPPRSGQTRGMVDGPTLRRLREERGMSREDLANAIGYTAVTSGIRQIQRWETGETANPRSAQYYKAVELLTGERQAGMLDMLADIQAKLDIVLRLTIEQREALGSGTWDRLPPERDVERSLTRALAEYGVSEPG